MEPPGGEGYSCGMARACVKQLCVACETNTQCERGESCVLDHCVLTERVKCRSSKDCATNSKCILSGYSPDLRGNGTMDAYCVDPKGGSNKPHSVPRPPPTPEQLERARHADDIQADLKRARALR